MKNCRLLNNVTGHPFACSEFLDVLKAVLAYAITFEESYSIYVDDARIIDIYEDLDSANFLPSSSRTTYTRYIRSARLCGRCEDLLPLVGRPNTSPALTTNMSTVKLALRRLCDS